MGICTSVGWLRYTTIQTIAAHVRDTITYCIFSQCLHYSYICTHASCHVYTMRFYNYKVLYIFVYIITTIYTIAYRTINTIV